MDALRQTLGRVRDRLCWQATAATVLVYGALALLLSELAWTAQRFLSSDLALLLGLGAGAVVMLAAVRVSELWQNTLTDKDWAAFLDRQLAQGALFESAIEGQTRATALNGLLEDQVKECLEKADLEAEFSWAMPAGFEVLVALCLLIGLLTMSGRGVRQRTNPNPNQSRSLLLEPAPSGKSSKTSGQDSKNSRPQPSRFQLSKSSTPAVSTAQLKKRLARLIKKMPRQGIESSQKTRRVSSSSSKRAQTVNKTAGSNSRGSRPRAAELGAGDPRGQRHLLPNDSKQGTTKSGASGASNGVTKPKNPVDGKKMGTLPGLAGWKQRGSPASGPRRSHRLWTWRQKLCLERYFAGS